MSRSCVLRSETYGSLTTGTPVTVAGEDGSWNFRHHCTNIDTGSEWLDVFGGERGAETLRAFRADRVSELVVPMRRRRRKTILEELL